MPVDYGGAPSEIYRNLRERILRGQIRSGSRIRIGAVAEEFGVSIIPVREALRMLAADRLIDLLPRRSPVISGITAHEVLEISAIRLALEPLALAGAIPNMSGETLRKSREVLEDYERCSDPWGQVELNRKFHLILYTSCRKGRLMKIISDQYDGMTRCAQVLVIRSSKAVDKSVMEHEEILKACEARDVESATAVLHSHLQASNDRLHERLMVEAGPVRAEEPHAFTRD